MKKLLLSLTVILASGAYAFAERQAPDASGAAALSVGPGDPKVSSLGNAAPSATPESLPTAAEPVAAPVLPARPAATVPESPVAAPTSHAAARESGPSVDVAAIDRPAPADETAAVVSDAPQPSVTPLPRPRPADAPQAPVVVAQAAAASSPQGQYKDGSYTGSSANAYYGRVQVAAVIKGGQIVSINVLQYPSDRRTSRYINSHALPMLEQEVVQAQSANVDIVSGATLTSNAYRQSLAKALSAARGGNA